MEPGIREGRVSIHMQDNIDYFVDDLSYMYIKDKPEQAMDLLTAIGVGGGVANSMVQTISQSIQRTTTQNVAHSGSVNAHVPLISSLAGEGGRTRDIGITKPLTSEKETQTQMSCWCWFCLVFNPRR